MSTFDSLCAKLRANTDSYRRGLISLEKWSDNVAALIEAEFPDVAARARAQRDARESLARVPRTGTATTTR